MKQYLITESEKVHVEAMLEIADYGNYELEAVELPPNARVLTPEDIAAGLDRCGLGNTREETAEYLNEELFDRGTRAQGKWLTREQVQKLVSLGKTVGFYEGQHGRWEHRLEAENAYRKALDAIFGSESE